MSLKVPMALEAPTTLKALMAKRIFLPQRVPFLISVEPFVQGHCRPLKASVSSLWTPLKCVLACLDAVQSSYAGVSIEYRDQKKLNRAFRKGPRRGLQYRVCRARRSKKV